MKNHNITTYFKIQVVTIHYDRPGFFRDYCPNGSFSLTDGYHDNPFMTEKSARDHLNKLLKARHDEIVEYKIVKFNIITLEEIIHSGVIIEKEPHTPKHCLHCGDPIPEDSGTEFCNSECRDSHSYTQ